MLALSSPSPSRISTTILNPRNPSHSRPSYTLSNPRLRTIRSSSSSAATSTAAETKFSPVAEKFPAAAGKKVVAEEKEKLPEVRAAKRVVLVRHGQSTWNAEGRIQGSSDFSVLTPVGEAQAETSRQMLLDDSFDVCFTSPLARSKLTAEIIWDSRKEPMIPDSDLREIDLYSFQGLLKHEGKEKFGAAFRQWQVDAPNFIIDGHYPVRELWARARSCWDRILTHESKSVLVVAHNAVNQALVATALGLGTEYFRVLLQSNCGVSVLDFTPQAADGSPNISLNRLNQTPNSPIASGSSAGRKSSQRIILVCNGILENNEEVSCKNITSYLLQGNRSNLGDQPLNMLGVIQSQKTAELLLDLKVNTVVSSSRKASMQTADTISKVQEAADCLGADCVPRYVDVKEIAELDVETTLAQSEGFAGLRLSALWEQTGKVWQALLEELSDPSEQEKVVVAVGHPVLHTALLAHCLKLSIDCVGLFHLNEGSISVIDFPDGPTGGGTIRCINYTAHLGRWSIPITKSTVDAVELY